jgi:hypothetical protein
MIQTIEKEIRWLFLSSGSGLMEVSCGSSNWFSSDKYGSFPGCIKFLELKSGESGPADLKLS